MARSQHDEPAQWGPSSETSFGTTEVGAPETQPERPTNTNLAHRCLIASVRSRLFGRPSALRVGRYRLERGLGMGGMGEVFLAVDDELEREVALKLVRGDCDGEIGFERLRREAKALARLSHPNVVQVYEVGEFEGQTFVAMEYVEGEDLRAWIEREPTWRRIIDVYLGAARALSAIHSVGLVHRDFKPDNVLLGADGRARVVDFGLARSEEPALTVVNPDAVLPADDRLSRSGAIMGTPRYMSLEQALGNIGPASDQFSFCVSLYEALWGEAPFDGASTSERLRALMNDELHTPPRVWRLPRGLWPIIKRGLSREVDDRWPDMLSLTRALERVRDRRRRWLTAASMPVVALASVGLYGLLTSPPPPIDACDATVDVERSQIWNHERAGQIEQAFARADLPYAAQAGARARDELARWSHEWADARAAQCAAVRAAAVDPSLLARRGACLTQLRIQAETLSELLSVAEASTVAHAPDAVGALPAVSACMDDEGLLYGVEPPSQDQAEAVQGARTRLTSARARYLLGRLSDAREIVDRVSADARALDYPPLRVEIDDLRARIELDGGSLTTGLERLEAAAELAEAHRHDRLASEAWTTLAMRAAGELADPSRGHAWLKRAQIALTRLSDQAGAYDRSRLALAEGALAALSGDHETAAKVFERALEELEGSSSYPGPRWRPSILAQLADARAALGEARVALELRRRAHEAAQAYYGPSHPVGVAYTEGYGLALSEAGRGEHARPLLETAAATWLAAHGQDSRHTDLGRAHELLTAPALERGDLELAQRHAAAAASIFRAQYPSGHPSRIEAEINLGVLAYHRGQLTEALNSFDAAALELEGSSVPDPVTRAAVEANRGAVLLELDRDGDAERAFARAFTDEGSPTHALTAHLGLAQLHLRRQQTDAAALSLARAGALADLFDDEERDEHAMMTALVELRRGGACRGVPKLSETAHAALRRLKATDAELRCITDARTKQ